MLNDIKDSIKNLHSQTGPIIGGLKKALPVAVGVNFLIDATGSSDKFAKGIQKLVIETAKSMETKVEDFQIGLHICRDRDFDKDFDFSLGSDLTVDEFEKNVSRIEYIGGGDELETQLDSLVTIAENHPWNHNNEARRVIVCCTSSGSKPTEDGKDVQAVGELLKAHGIKAIVVAPTDSNLVQLASITGGDVVAISNDPADDEIRKVTRLLTKTLTQVANSKAKTKTMVMPPNNSHGQNGTQQVV